MREEMTPGERGSQLVVKGRAGEWERTEEEGAAFAWINAPFAHVSLELEGNDEDRLVDVEIHDVLRVVRCVVVDHMRADLESAAKVRLVRMSQTLRRREKDAPQHGVEKRLSRLAVSLYCKFVGHF